MVENAYRQVLHEFRADIFQRLSLIIPIAFIVVGFILVYIDPLPHQFILALQIFCVFAFYIRSLSSRYPILSRYLFVISLYALLCAGMLLLPVSWLPFAVAPLLFVSELLVSHIAIVAGGLFLGFSALLAHTGYADYPIESLLLFIVFVLAVSHSSLRTIWNLLHWYLSMFGRTNALLEETRARRAELLQTLKSLEIARETQQRLQTQLVYARQQAEEARQMKERFASNISHELRTPLNIILGFTEIMHLTPEVYGEIQFPPKLQQDIYQVHRNSRHLLDMIDDVLDLSHIELSQFTLNFERTNLNVFLQDTVGIVANLFKHKPVEFVVDIASDLPEIQIDRTRIRQVIINLINNAQRFTPQGRVCFSAYANDKDVVFQVADTGIGIPQDQIHLIFDEFFQVDYSLSRSNGGAGLGLAITRRFIEAHHGRLQVESDAGAGSVFTFTLPLPEPVTSYPRAVQKAAEITREAVWLVVDADPHVSKLIRRHMSGVSIVQIASLDELEAAVQRYSPQGVIYNQPHDRPLPDCLTDLAIPVAACSLPSTTQMVMRLGIDACLSKPVLPEQLIQALEPYEGAKNILIIDDDVGVVQMVQRTLEYRRPNLTIRRAYNGQQACEMMRASAPDLVLLDLVMPTVSGFEVISMMKEVPHLQKIPIILLTATKYISSDIESRGELRVNQQGGLKPMVVLKLLKMITEAVNSQ